MNYSVDILNIQWPDDLTNFLSHHKNQYKNTLSSLDGESKGKISSLLEAFTHARQFVDESPNLFKGEK